MSTDIDPEEQARLAGLQARFLQALDARRRGDVDGAAELLRGVLQVEPRLAEPRLELAHLLVQTGQLEEAAAQAREAIVLLEAGGQWTEDLPEDVLLSLAYGTLGEALRLQADEDAVVFGDPDTWQRLTSEARSALRKAAALDPDNTHAGYWAFDPRDAARGEE